MTDADGGLRKAIKLLIDKQTTAVTMDGKMYPAVSRETLADEYEQLFHAEQKKILERLKGQIRGEGEPSNAGEMIAVNEVDDILDKELEKYE